jgi:glucan phosphoethanolaminetransferase (alkaline phosphatase superfamily)
MPGSFLLSALLACSTPEPPAERPSGDEPAKRTKTEAKAERAKAEAKATKSAKTKVTRPEVRTTDGDVATVLFVVLDTVRADRMHMCGYERENTPYLDSLIARKNGS